MRNPFWYAATGALIVHEAGATGRRLFLASFVVAGLAATLISLGLTSLALYGVHVPHAVSDPRVAGFAQNPNALAFQLLLVIAAIIALRWPERWLRLALAFALTALFFAGSRASAGGVAVMLGVALWLRFLRPRDALAAVTLAAALVIVLGGEPLAWVHALSGSVPAGAAGGAARRHGLALFVAAVNAGLATSSAQHWTSVVLAWRMFLDHPLFGAGLGAFYASFLREHGYALVVHSTPVWLLAEMGIVGLAAFLAPFFGLLYNRLRAVPGADPSSVLIILSLLAFSVMGSVHEMLYQRALWLVLGAALVAVRESGASERRAATPSVACGGADARSVAA